MGSGTIPSKTTAKCNDYSFAGPNLSYWRYLCPELKGVLSPANELLGVTFSPDGKTILTGSADGAVRIWDATTAKPIGQLLVPGTRVSPWAFSPDGRTVLTVMSERTAQLWDAVTMQPIGQPMEHRGRIWSVAFSPDGKSVLIGSEEKTARLWDAATGLPFGRTFEDQEPILFVAFSPDGKTVLTSVLGNTRLWDAATSQPIGQLRSTSTGSILAPLFSPDGHTILTSDAQLWDAATAQPIGKPLRPRVNVSVFNHAFSPDGKTILIVSTDATARLWDAATSQPIGQPMVHQGRVWSVAFSPDSTLVVTSDGNKVRFWDAATGLPIGPPLQHDAAVQSARFSPNGKTVLTVSEDDTARLWDAATALPIGQPLDEKYPISRAKYSPDGRTILIESFQGTARLWDAVALRPIGRWIISPGLIASAAFRPDGNALLTASGNTARQWDAITAQPIGLPFWHQNRVGGATYSPDGRTILTVSFDRTSRLWDAATGQSIGHPLAHEGAIRRACFSPDGKMVLTGSDDNTARQWDVANAQPVGQPMVHRTAVTWVAYSPDGRTLLTSSGGTSRLWDALTGRQIGQPMKHQGMGASIVQRMGVSIAFSPNGRTILAGGPGNAARLWDATSGEALGQPLQHGAAVTRVAYSPDGALLITGSEDRTIRLWDASTTLPIGHPFQHDSAVGWIACSPDGKAILTGDSPRARLWRLPILMDDELPRIRAWVETITGLRVDDQGAIRALDSAAWKERRERLRTLGGPPKSDPGWLFDPILHGLEPTAKARAWSKRKRWTEAEAAFDEAVRARPLNGAIHRERGWFFVDRKRTDKGDVDFACAYFLGDGLPHASREDSFGSFDFDLLDRYINDKVIDHIRNLYPDGAIEPSTGLLLSRAGRLVKRRQWDEARAMLIRSCNLPLGIPEDSKLLQLRGDLFAEMGCWDRAAADYGEVIQRWPEQHSIRHRQILSLLVAGNRAGLRRAVSDLLDLFGRTTDPGTAQDVAWYCVLVPGDVVDHEVMIRLAELASPGYYAAQARFRGSIAFLPNTLGAALYRAGRLEDSIRQLEEGIHLRKGTADPADWAYLAMAHFRAGHRVEAHRWLDRLRNYQPNHQTNTHSRFFWDELGIRVLRSEAEAVILYDPDFPADPFAH